MICANMVRAYGKREIKYGTKPFQIRFIGTDSTVISLLPGQTYLIIEKTTEDWWLAANDQGKLLNVPKLGLVRLTRYFWTV